MTDPDNYPRYTPNGFCWLPCGIEGMSLRMVNGRLRAFWSGEIFNREVPMVGDWWMDPEQLA